MTFTDVTERLSWVPKCDSVSVHGIFTRNSYATQGAEQRDGFSLLVESMVCALKVGKKRSRPNNNHQTISGVPFDDPLPK
jgi:hypothetical protein